MLTVPLEVEGRVHRLGRNVAFAVNHTQGDRNSTLLMTSGPMEVTCGPPRRPASLPPGSDTRGHRRTVAGRGGEGVGGEGYFPLLTKLTHCP
jgi:hypothetical protein